MYIYHIVLSVALCLSLANFIYVHQCTGGQDIWLTSVLNEFPSRFRRFRPIPSRHNSQHNRDPSPGDVTHPESKIFNENWRELYLNIYKMTHPNEIISYSTKRLKKDSPSQEYNPNDPSSRGRRPQQVITLYIISIY